MRDPDLPDGYEWGAPRPLSEGLALLYRAACSLKAARDTAIAESQRKAEQEFLESINHITGSALAEEGQPYKIDRAGNGGFTITLAVPLAMRGD